MEGFTRTSCPFRRCGHRTYPWLVRSPRTSSNHSQLARRCRCREFPFDRAGHPLLPAHIDKVVAKLPEVVPTVDILLATSRTQSRWLTNLQLAPDWSTWLVRWRWRDTAGTRVNSLDSPWGLDDILTLVGEVGDKLDVIMVPKVEGPEESTTSIDCRPTEAKANLYRRSCPRDPRNGAGALQHRIDRAASPRMQGLSLGPADLAADRRMKTTRVGAGTPLPRARRPDPDNANARGRSTSRTCGTTRWRGWSTPA